MAVREGSILKFKLSHLPNGTIIANILEYRPGQNNSNDTSQSDVDEYDDQGALFYVIVVVLIYGCSIVLMIGSSMKKSRDENLGHKYMQDLDRIKRLERKQEKFKTRLMMTKHKYLHILGQDRADVNIAEEWSASEIKNLRRNAVVDTQSLTGSECSPLLPPQLEPSPDVQMFNLASKTSFSYEKEIGSMATLPDDNEENTSGRQAMTLGVSIYSETNSPLKSAASSFSGLYPLPEEAEIGI